MAIDTTAGFLNKNAVKWGGHFSLDEGPLKYGFPDQLPHD